MNAKKLALAAALAGVMGAAGTVSATIIGVPSEGLLVPLGMQGVNRDSGVAAYTGVLIETPALVGVDTIINDYTAPNTTKGGYTPPEAKGEWNGGMTVHYYMFDEKSEHVYDSTFVMSPDDVYFWMPPCSLFDYGEGPCGSKTWIGYVVFADEAARKGGPATFVMTGQAGIAYASGRGPDQIDELMDVPVVPLSDGDDAGGIRIGNEITYSQQQLPRIDDVVPIVAGTRYGGAPGTTTTIVTGLIPLGRNLSEIFNIAHVMWFSENGMTADMDFCDDEEWCVSCTDWTFNEVNILSYAHERSGEGPPPLVAEEGPMGGPRGDTLMYDGVKAFKDAMAFQRPENCEGPDCWFSPTVSGDVCGVGASIHFASDLAIEELPNMLYPGMGHYAGLGLALYEFANKAGVVGVNFQVGTSDPRGQRGGPIGLPGYWGESLLTAPMLTNGQF